MGGENGSSNPETHAGLTCELADNPGEPAMRTRHRLALRPLLICEGCKPQTPMISLALCTGSNHAARQLQRTA